VGTLEIAIMSSLGFSTILIINESSIIATLDLTPYQLALHEQKIFH
jgi:hypothetical protein